MSPRLLLAALTVAGTVAFPAPAGVSEPFSPPISRDAYPDPANVSTARLGAVDRASRNRMLARVIAQPYGWHHGRQWACLVRLWHRESRWRDDARNPTTGAYGIPQKMGDPLRTPHRQIDWGLAYIEHRYGTPCAALDFQLKRNWY